ncbi:MAG TPA: GNAT family N-acetyltransferase [Anaerolineales bacterium]|nr:GNAT family N-acetyltransferase [Anaerolineales bacterium]
MIEIRRIKPDEWSAAKRVVYRAAYDIFEQSRSLEESIEFHESRGELNDMDDIQKNYFENGGVFFVILDDEELIGTGAIRYYSGEMCELKRLWLLTEHQGKGLGYRMIQELFSIARGMRYKKIRLDTDPNSQKRAYDLYKRIGFRDLHPHPDHPDDIVMELDL